MSRVFNFSAGPAALPDAILERVRNDIPDWNGTGMSIMEISHRSKEFMAVAAPGFPRWNISEISG